MAIAVVVVFAPAVAGAAPMWSLLANSNNGTHHNDLGSVSCVSASSCKAVGGYFNGNGVERTLIESWNGNAWTVVPSPNTGTYINLLMSVSSASATSCKAVGFSYLNGSAFSRTLIESWNGSTWSIILSPNHGPFSNNLTSVSCVSANSCKAIGTFNVDSSTSGIRRTLIESWNGSTWSVVPSPNVGTQNNDLTSVSCVSASFCKAVGVYVSNTNVLRTMIESWNGSTWSVATGRNNGAHDNTLNSVSCVSATSCKAVGFYFDGTRTRTLIESWNGSTWSVVPSPNTGMQTNYLTSVSCASATSCKAVGFYVSSSTYRTLVESWNGASWSLMSSPNNGTHNNYLAGVSCVSVSACMAGGYFTNLGVDRTLFERYG